MSLNHFYPVFLQVIILVVGLSGLFSQNNNGLNLGQCIEKAWENNLQLRQQSLSVDISRSNLLQSRASAFPSLNANASHSYSFGRTVDPFTNEFSTESIQSNNFSINSSVSLFNGFQIRNTIQQNKLEVQAGEYDLEKSYNDIALMVASAYLQILFNIELVENVTNQVEITSQQVSRTEKLVSAGTLPRGALLTIEAQLATEELQLVNARNQLDLSFLNLKQIMVWPEDEDLTLVIPDIEIEPTQELNYTPMEVYRVAVQEQPDVRSAELRIASSERGLAVAKGTRYPSLNLGGSLSTGYSEARFEVFEQNPTGINQVFRTDEGVEILVPVNEPNTRVKPFSDQINDNLSQSLGLFLSIPIFNNFQARSAVSRSRIGVENAKLQSMIVREQLFQTIQQAHADASAALKRYSATEKNVDALQESFRYTEQRFNVGMVNSVEYNDAKNRLSAAESELLQAKYEYIFRTQILEFYLGQPLSLQ